MDLLDKQLLLALNANCRASYQALTKELGLTINAVKKRVDKLVERGIIREYYVYLSLAMSGGEMLLVTLTIDEGYANPKLIDELGANKCIFAGSYLADGRILLFAEYCGALELDQLGQFLRATRGVTLNEMHTLLYEKGKRCDLTYTDLSVLKTLRNNARMPIAKIADETQLTPRRVRSVLKKLMGEGGSAPEYFADRTSFGDARTTQQCAHFRIRWDLNAGGATTFIIRIDWNIEKGTRAELIEWLQTEYPIEFWYALTSASQPTLFAVFAIEHMRNAVPIAQRILNHAVVKSVDPLFGYPTRSFASPRDHLLDQLFKDAGL